MNSARLVVVLVLAGMSVGVSGAKGFSLFSRSWGNVVVATDTTPEGEKLERPTPSRPVYYRGRSLGVKLGSIPGDTLPPEDEMNRVVAKVLAQQGYLGATPGVHEPTLFIIVQWGYLRPGSDDLLWFLGYDADQDIGAPAIAGQLGPEVWRRGFRSRTIETILEGAGTANYGFIITAFEYHSASTSEPVIYWQTRVALPANGKSMADALPAMVVAAGPAIGVRAQAPALINVDRAREVSVELGELEYQGVVEDPPVEHPE